MSAATLDLVRSEGASWRSFVPAAVIALTAMVALGGAELLPFGQQMLLIRVPEGSQAAGLMAAAAADAAYVSSPQPGFAVLYGDAARIRAAAGLALPWNGAGLCAVAE